MPDPPAGPFLLDPLLDYRAPFNLFPPCSLRISCSPSSPSSSSGSSTDSSYSGTRNHGYAHYVTHTVLPYPRTISLILLSLVSWSLIQLSLRPNRCTCIVCPRCCQDFTMSLVLYQSFGRARNRVATASGGAQNATHSDFRLGYPIRKTMLTFRIFFR